MGFCALYKSNLVFCHHLLLQGTKSDNNILKEKRYVLQHCAIFKEYKFVQNYNLGQNWLQEHPKIHSLKMLYFINLKGYEMLLILKPFANRHSCPAPTLQCCRLMGDEHSSLFQYCHRGMGVILL